MFCIDRLVGEGLSAQTVAMYDNGSFLDNVQYALKDTPCGAVVGNRVCCFPTGVRGLFPKDQVLQEMKADSYIGTTLFGYDGKPIGLIAVIGRKPLADPGLAEAVLRLVALRAADELERAQAEEALRKAHDELERKVRERTADLSRAVDSLQDEVRCRMLAEETLAHRANQLRHVAAELAMAEQRERRRLAEVLHDGLQQLLVGAKYGLHSLTRSKQQAVRETAAKVSDIISECVESSRSLTAELCPPILREGGFAPAMEWLAHWMRDKHGLLVHLDVQCEFAAPEEVTLLLFQATRESAVQHRQARGGQDGPREGV